MKKNISDLWREHKMLLVITSAIILMQTLVGVVLWDRLPDPIATHFNFRNEPGGWSSKAFTVFGMPLILLALHWVCLLVGCSPNHQMKNYHGKIKYVVLFMIPATAILMMVLCYGYALGAPFDIGRIVLVFVGVIFAVTGNYMPKIRRNYTMGIKLPWTMADDENWNKTHRMAAPVWVVCGLLLIVLGLIGYTTWFALAVICIMVFLPVAYSFLLHLQKNRQ
ncbi:MAG: SdpI family protein [Clostridia bacterium]|nr:SdpI family protein [Clostridia bacterium]